MSDNTDKRKKVPRVKSIASMVSTGTETPAYPIFQLLKRAAASDTD